MSSPDPKVDGFLAGATRWRGESTRLREILLDAGLDEALKWGKPCYAADGRNLAIVQPMKAFLALMFFKGALLDDPAGVLEEQGENSRGQRRICFTSVAQVDELAGVVGALVRQAVEVERAGLTLPERPAPVLADELQARLDVDPELRAAFEGLTPGRQREYNLHISGAKQSATRARRVDQLAPRILEGKGLRDR